MHHALILAATSLALPSLAFAGDGIDPELGYLENLSEQTVDLLDILIGLVVTLALLAFFWGLAVFIFNAGDDEARKKGRNIMIWGILALFFIVAVWGLVALVTQIFLGGDVGDDAEVPGIEGRAVGGAGGAGDGDGAGDGGDGDGAGDGDDGGGDFDGPFDFGGPPGGAPAIPGGP